MQHEQQFYPVLEVCLQDFEDECFDEKEWGDVAAKAYMERLAFARQMSADQWRELAEIIGNILFDGDWWDDALSYAIDDLMSHSAATPLGCAA